MQPLRDRRVHSKYHADWQLLRDNLTDCSRCGLCKVRHKVALLRGSIPCNILYIGEAPGETENALGITMCGPTRKVMDELNELVQRQLTLDLPIVWAEGRLLVHKPITYGIINVVQCRPPENRNPRRGEAMACIDHVRSYIELTKPRMLVLCGSVALQYVSELMNHMDLRPLPTIEHIPHPAYILRKKNTVQYNNLLTKAADAIASAYTLTGI